VLNAMRRAAVDQLQSRQARRSPIAVDVEARDARMREAVPGCAPEAATGAALHLLVRTKDQLAAAIDLRPASITLDYLDLYGLRPSVDLIRSNGIEVRVATPRVLKPGEEKIADFLVRLDCPLLVRAAGLIPVLRARTAQPLTGDFSLNAANSLTASALLALGLDRLTPAHDLNAAQIAALALATGGDKIEAAAYQHLPVFHTEHCVFCRFLSTGTSYRDCGRPCEAHQLTLRDPLGRAHPVMADVGCRNTVFGAEAQQASAHIERWLAAGIRHWRLEFVQEPPDSLTAVAEAWRDALSGRIAAPQLAQRLKTAAPEGITEGSLYIAKDYLSLPVLA
jgi:putative protease